MIIEETRQNFLDLLNNNDFIISQASLALYLVIPVGMLNELINSEKEKDIVIKEGVKILQNLDNGIFARVGWTDYFCITNGNDQEVEKIIKEVIKKSTLKNKNFGLWQVVVNRIGNYNAKQLFDEISNPIANSYKLKN